MSSWARQWTLQGHHTKESSSRCPGLSLHGRVFHYVVRHLDTSPPSCYFQCACIPAIMLSLGIGHPSPARSVCSITSCSSRMSSNHHLPCSVRFIVLRLSSFLSSSLRVVDVLCRTAVHPDHVSASCRRSFALLSFCYSALSSSSFSSSFAPPPSSSSSSASASSPLCAIALRLTSSGLCSRASTSRACFRARGAQSAPQAGLPPQRVGVGTAPFSCGRRHLHIIRQGLI